LCCLISARAAALRTLVMLRIITVFLSFVFLTGCNPTKPEEPRYGSSRERPVIVPLLSLVIVPERHAQTWVSTVGYLDSDPRQPSLFLSSPSKSSAVSSICVSFSATVSEAERKRVRGKQIEVIGYFEYFTSTEVPYSRGTLDGAIIRELDAEIDIPGGPSHFPDQSTGK